MSLKLIDAFLEMILAERGAAGNTVIAYRRDLKELYNFLDSKKTRLEKATKEDLQDYIAFLKSSRLSAKTGARRLCAMREFYRFLYSEDIIKKNPADYLQSPKLNKSLPKYLTEAEIDLLIKGAQEKNKQIYFMFELLYATGMRVSELVGLPITVVTHDLSTLTIIGKGNKERIVPLNENARESLKNWLDERSKNEKKKNSKWLFPSSSKTGHITRDGFFKAMKTIATEKGMPLSRVSPHVFRHSFASHLIQHDADLRSVQKMLGHANITTTEIYTHILQDRLKKTVENSHPLSYSRREGL
ncbi:MAG: tyrosine recombinase [Alphaproteobacteria bacterium]|nr:tyrosine recombinase [Alphaproteobacteria bacterium]